MSYKESTLIWTYKYATLEVKANIMNIDLDFIESLPPFLHFRESKASISRATIPNNLFQNP